MRRAFAVVILAPLMLLSAPAYPCGPGIHILEAARAGELLATMNEAWAADLASPLAAEYLALGSIAPDFQNALGTITFGHSAALSYHLLDAAAEKGPEYRLFALGHLAHASASDPACEMFLTPTLLASAPIGIMDITTEDGPQGESEGLIEVFGDLILGDWDTLVDVVYAFYMDGPDAEARGQDIFMWYCLEGKAQSGHAVDCNAAWAEFTSLVDSGKAFLGDMDRETAREFLHSMIDQPPAALAEVFAGGIVQQLLGDRMDKSANYDREFARFISGPAMDPAFWARYDDFLYRLGPEWVVERLRTRETGFPSWSGNAMIAGNVQSMMNFVPDAYHVVPGLIVDDVRWLNGAGQAVSSLAAAHEGTPMTARVRFFSSYPFDGTIRGVVRKDLPGRNVAADPIVAQADLAIAIDPLAYVTTPRHTLEVPFTVDTEGAIGLYLDLWVDGGNGPWLTTNWDLIWGISDLDLDQPSIRNHFGTYGHWPPSLPVAAPTVPDGRVLVKARVAPAGGGIDRAQVTFGAEGPSWTTGFNGIAVFDITDTTTVPVSVAAEGFAPADPVEAQPALHADVWVESFLHGIPRITVAPWTTHASCIAYSVARDPFQGQVSRFLTHAQLGTDIDVRTPVVETPADKEGAVCFPQALEDGAQVLLRTVPRYRNDTLGVEGTAIAWLDASAPLLDAPEFQVMDDPCHEDVPFIKPFVVSVRVTEPHSPIDVVDWKSDGDWVVAAWDAVPGEVAGTFQISFPVDVTVLRPGDTLSVRVANAAGLATQQSATLPSDVVTQPCPVDPEPQPDAGTPDSVADEARPDAWTPPDADDAALTDAQTPGQDVLPPIRTKGGCSAGPNATGTPLGLLWLVLLGTGIVWRRSAKRAG